MTNKSKKILTEISAGELLDKICILEIKLANIKDKEKLAEINKEYNSLEETRKSNIEITENLQKLINKLSEINLKLWSIEEEKRICEKKADFGNNFIQLSRNVYINNDKRAKIKSDINKLLGSNIKEVKSY
jgi:predicted nuclease with TOPRIM domain